MAHCIGFNAVARSDARVLILGTLPSVESLKQGQYYAKKQNGFWKILGELIGASPDLPYEKRLQHLTKNRIALWDVCKMAEREGSLDAAIQSPEPNDFHAFFKTHKYIELIGFNGQPAAKLFNRYVKPDMPEQIKALPCVVLPSTSPAHAGMRFEEKLSRWRDALGAFVSCA
ncbi:MAG: DNA-deoxyinosine glycosylase [Alphaproteobacteria bacterium]